MLHSFEKNVCPTLGQGTFWLCSAVSLLGMFISHLPLPLAGGGGPGYLLAILSSRVECGNYFWLDRTGQLTRSGMILEVQIQNFSARASKFSFSKKSRWLKYQQFFVKIGMKLSFTKKNKCINTNLKFECKNYFIFTFEKVHFWFLKKNNNKFFFYLWFGSDLALKTINTQMLFCLVFLKMHQKKLLTAKNAIFKN